ncbi:hypothetical protein CTI12_AA550650 [Artemisia annua]|uniref:Reverse transcriptase zinc-binding domain-containing protein n=1 Tax=Artemisia annua TaxID=35608 RepID=A0A2U1KYG4_ARTAN|nr:hypothetical protein CTI12_AA550650 [Artemisia annua]
MAKINVQKSNILGVCVSNEDVSEMAKLIGCGAANLPLKYLSVPVGCNMSRCSNWNAIIHKFSSKLSQWKAHNDRGCNVTNRLQVSDWSFVLRRLPRRGEESSQFTSLLSAIEAVSLSDHNDSWLWSLDSSSGFTVASVRSLIDANSLDVDSNATRWNRSIPIKVNVFLWRLMLNKLPTRVNLLVFASM